MIDSFRANAPIEKQRPQSCADRAGERCETVVGAVDSETLDDAPGSSGWTASRAFSRDGFRTGVDRLAIALADLAGVAMHGHTRNRGAAPVAGPAVAPAFGLALRQSIERTQIIACVAFGVVAA